MSCAALASPSRIGVGPTMTCTAACNVAGNATATISASKTGGVVRYVIVVLERLGARRACGGRSWHGGFALTKDLRDLANAINLTVSETKVRAMGWQASRQRSRASSAEISRS